MRAIFYKLICLTNLHMGSGDINYDVVDLEVERDPVLREPTMNASGVKGALRDYFDRLNQAGHISRETVLSIFGSDANEKNQEEKNKGTRQGTYHFLSGDLIARPVRVSEGNPSYVLATTPELLKHVGTKLTAFGLNNPFADVPDAQENVVLTGASCKEIENIRAKQVECKPLEAFLGKQWALMSPKQLAEIDLPVLAHNVLEDGISKNLWYEQVVPHESVFGLLVIAPEGDTAFENALGANTVVQFGAGATTGNGFTRLEKQETGGMCNEQKTGR